MFSKLHIDDLQWKDYWQVLPGNKFYLRPKTSLQVAVAQATTMPPDSAHMLRMRTMQDTTTSSQGAVSMLE